LATTAKAKTKQPNIVLVLFDDLGWRDFGCFGNERKVTPNLDAIAKEGVKFTQAYAACPVCSPTRAALLTGKYPPRTGVTDWIAGRPQWPTAKLITPRTKTELALEETTVAESLKLAGYRTAAIGKWHLGGNNGFLPTDQGFDHNTGGNHRGSNGYFGPFDLPGLEGRNSEHYLTTELGSAARKWVSEERPDGKPFFLYWANYAVHLPLQAPGFKRSEGTYWEMLRIADEQIGLMRQQLKASGQDENTIWVISSDNGGLRYEGKSSQPVTDNAPLRAGKGHLYQGGLRVPLIVKAPGWSKAGQTLEERVSSIDLYPTLMEMAGEKRPEGIDGISLASLISGKEKKLKREALYWHYPHYSNQGGVPGGAIIEDDWKLIEFYEDGRRELFHLSEDFGERINLAGLEKTRAERMWRKLDQWRKNVGAVMPRANPGFDPTKADQGLSGTETQTLPSLRK
jgi:arylsulfatase A-like enzyme